VQCNKYQKVQVQKIRLSDGNEFEAALGVSLLEAALANGIALPHSCRTGRCSACKCKVSDGETQALQPETGLSDVEKSEGWILSCVRAALSDVTLEVDCLDGINLPPVKTWPCRISSINHLTSNVIGVSLRLPPSAEFNFIPGQFVDVIGPGGIRRSYSLANADFAGKSLELHIRCVHDGIMSDYWFFKAQVNDLLRIHGPIGTFFLRQIEKVNLVFLATGTGIAPVKAMIEALVGVSPKRAPRSVAVYWGGRTSEDIYFDIGSIPVAQRFQPVLSRPDASWLGATGYVQDAFLNDNPDLNNTVVYACGSDAMIRGAKDALTKAGLPSSCFYADAFVCSAVN
jgi:CDP-4-dehydro-6-deoxyglucose reductase